MKLWTILALSIVLGGLASDASAQGQQKALPAPPPGFTAPAASAVVVSMRSSGVADLVEAEKENAGWPGCMIDPKVRFRYGWTKSPGADQVVSMMIQAPQDPATTVMGTKSEPAGKKAYKGGVVEWRKRTTLVAGSSGACPGNQVVMHDGTWVGYVAGKLLSVSVASLYGPKEAGQAWIDEYVDKVIAVVTSPQ